MFTIDGATWPVACKITRTAELKASEISGMLLDRSYFNDVLGTWMRYEVEVQVPFGQEAAYDALYERLTDPVAGHVFVMPYGQGTISFTGRVEMVKDLHYLRGQTRYWAEVTFQAIANEPSKAYTLAQVLGQGTQTGEGETGGQTGEVEP